MERKFLKDWPDPPDWTRAEEKGRVTGAHLEPVRVHYIDARRDIEQDLHQRGSFWRRLTEDLGLSEDEITNFESILSALNQQIIEKSEVLQHLQNELQNFARVVATETARVELAPVARHLRDLKTPL